ncbi:MAG: exonuclease SbcCD subunit D [candidate division KSB1 bacterium]|jgi:DNA repair exonuclease SbcCD nuclease subunit|nr:exonuclease SbcCD subunit D [candidate division KSB1 bacterium]
MKIIHFSDTHLGYSEYHKVDPNTGINQREQDFYNAWNHVIEAILTHKPDLVIHAGDLFHTTRPGNRAIAVALEGIQKLSDAGIPLVFVSGNHSTPKIRSTGSIFESIALFPHVHAAYRSRYERFRIGRCDVHCVPHCSLTEELEKAFGEIDIRKDADMNVLVTHGSWAGNKAYSMGEFNEQHIADPEGTLGLKFDYIALGHYHKHIEISDHIVYSGSTERTSFNEAGYTSGYVMVDLVNASHTYHEIPFREMMRLPSLACEQLTASEIYSALEKLSTPDLEQKLVTIELRDIQHDTFLKLDWREIDARFRQVFHLEKSFSQVKREGVMTGSSSFDSLPVEFERYADRLKLQDLDAERLKRLGLDYLSLELDDQ